MSTGLYSGVSGLAIGSGLWKAFPGLWGGATGLIDLPQTLSLDFLGGAPLDSRITFTRGTTATFVGSNGLIQSAAINTPRFDYDPVTLAAKGLLIEEQRTNLITYSEDLSNVAYTKPNVTINVDQIASPNGGVNADKVTGLATISLKNVRTDVAAITAGTVYTVSAYVKAIDAQFISVTFDDGATTNGVWASFDIINGTVTTSATAYGTGASAASSISALGGGWYRIRVTGTAGTTATAARVAFSIQPAGDTQFSNFSTTQAYYLWGIQVEAGTFATSYIPTVASQVTRSADNASMTGANFSSWYNQNAGTVVCNFALSGLTSGGAVSNIWILSASATPSTNFTRLREGTIISGADVEMFAGGVSQVDTNSFAITANATAKTAFAWATNSGLLSANGTLVGSEDTSVTPPTVNQLVLTGSNKWLHSLTYYPQRLPDATLQALTV